jgi:hypothetical protein
MMARSLTLKSGWNRLRKWKMVIETISMRGATTRARKSR